MYYLSRFLGFKCNKNDINPKNCGGGGRIQPIECRYGVYAFNFHQNFSIFFVESCWISAFTKIFFGKLRLLEVGPRGRWKRSSIFQSSHPSKKSMLSKANEQKKKKTICQIFHQKKIQKVLMKIEEMADIFLNSANFASHAFLTLAPPSGYALNLKALIKVSKVSWTSQFSYEILKSSLEKKT